MENKEKEEKQTNKCMTFEQQNTLYTVEYTESYDVASGISKICFNGRVYEQLIRSNQLDPQIKQHVDDRYGFDTLANVNEVEFIAVPVRNFKKRARDVFRVDVSGLSKRKEIHATNVARELHNRWKAAGIKKGTKIRHEKKAQMKKAELDEAVFKSSFRLRFDPLSGEMSNYKLKGRISRVCQGMRLLPLVHRATAWSFFCTCSATHARVESGCVSVDNHVPPALENPTNIQQVQNYHLSLNNDTHKDPHAPHRQTQVYWTKFAPGNTAYDMLMSFVFSLVGKNVDVHQACTIYHHGESEEVIMNDQFINRDLVKYVVRWNVRGQCSMTLQPKERIDVDEEIWKASFPLNPGEAICIPVDVLEKARCVVTPYNAPVVTEACGQAACVEQCRVSFHMLVGERSTPLVEIQEAVVAPSSETNDPMPSGYVEPCINNEES